MKHAYVVAILITLLSLTACDNSLQKVTPLVFEKRQAATETSPQTNESSEEAAYRQCMENESHPIAHSIAEKYEVTYQEIMQWNCAGITFEDILLALQTSKLSKVETSEILHQLEAKTWEQIWKELGVTYPQK